MYIIWNPNLHKHLFFTLSYKLDCTYMYIHVYACIISPPPLNNDKKSNICIQKKNHSGKKMFNHNHPHPLQKQIKRPYINQANYNLPWNPSLKKYNQGNDCLYYKVLSVKLKKISKKLNARGTSEVTLWCHFFYPDPL